MMQARRLRTLQALREALDRDEAIRREQDEEEEVSLIFFRCCDAYRPALGPGQALGRFRAPFAFVGVPHAERH